jgi:hypothetical protein
MDQASRVREQAGGIIGLLAGHRRIMYAVDL